MIRLILLDVPLMIIIFLYASLRWIGHVHENYLYPQIQAAVFDEDRSYYDITYYKRTCDSEDITATNGADLFLPADATPDDAYQHQLKHGSTVFKSALSPETAANLRNFVDDRNRKLKEEEKIFVISGDNRYSFGFGTEEPSVVAALKELTNSPILRPALEKVLGPDPALIEMTAITSSYGAAAQYWHDDIISDASTINFVRSFGPAYSLFIQLQNTTSRMGATGVCPGTHYCSQGDFAELCEKHGFQLVNEHGYWGIGDALLMNQNSFHRGAAHTDPDALDRIMFILTFTPKPQERAETRMLSQGITFSLRWDMWGHTLNDLAKADTAMSKPWATLRALGLYKTPGASWGIDYISGSIVRMANSDVGFRQQDLKKWIGWGGFKFLPSWLQGTVDFETDDSWYQFLTRTYSLCMEHVQKISVGALIVYISFFAVLSLYPGSPHGRSAIIFGVLLRVTLICSIAFFAFNWAKIYVDNSNWAADIRGQRRFASTTPYDRHAFLLERFDVNSSPSTLPTRYDVLVETRYGSEHLAMYNDFIGGHPGNRLFNDLLQKYSRTYNQYPAKFQNALAEYIVGIVEMEHGRFLMQNPDGHWLWMTIHDSKLYTKKELTKAAYPLLKVLLWQLRFMKSNGKYGIFRDSAMERFHSSHYLKTLENKLMNNLINMEAASGATIVATSSVSHLPENPSTFKLQPIMKSQARHIRRTATLDFDSVDGQPYDDAWLAAGDEVEAWANEHWYYGVIQNVSAHSTYNIRYPDGGDDYVYADAVRRYQPYEVDEKLYVYVPAEEGFYKGQITFVSENKTFDVYIFKLRVTLENVPLDGLRREGPSKESHDYDSGYH